MLGKFTQSTQVVYASAFRKAIRSLLGQQKGVKAEGGSPGMPCVAVEPSGGVVAYQRNTGEGGCPPEDIDDDHPSSPLKIRKC